MTLDRCDPCASTCISGNLPNDSFKQLVLSALCQVVANTGGGGGGGGTSSDFEAAFPAAGTAAGFTDGTNMQGARVYDTDSDVGGEEWTLGAQLRFEASGGSVPAPGTAADGLLVNLGTNNDVTVTGSVTANAGTNLNTSLLALETGGNLAAAAASLAIMDDWDEIDRAKVNIIAGQAGVSANTGNSDAGTQRVVIATDQPNLTTPLNVAGTVTATGTVAVSSITTSVTPGTGATHLGKAEDTPHTSGDVGVQILGVYQQNGAAAFVGTPLDYCPIGVTSFGAVNVNLDKNFRENASASAIKAEDEPSANTDALIAAGFVREDTPTTNTSTSGDWTPAKTTAQGVLWERPYVNGTVTSAGGTASSSGNNTLVAAGTNKLKVSKFSLSTTSTTAVTCIFQSGAGGTELWRVVLQAASSTSTGANLAVPAPDYIFATAAATLLNLNLSSAQTVHWSVGYVDEP